MRCPATIDIRIIPQSEQRYDTLGDWWWEDATLHIRASYGPGWQPFLVALHETVEAVLCEQSGISQEQVDEWDLSHLDAEEPGELEGCPYRVAHRKAGLLEHLMASFLGMHAYGKVS